MNLEREEALVHLRKMVGDAAAQFRPGQWEAIDALVNRRERVLVVQRTGWGKSNVYFIATWALRDQRLGLTLIISPLLALMRDQIAQGSRLGIHVTTINSTNEDEWGNVLAQARSNQVDALLISPERLANDRFRSDFLEPLSAGIGLLVVDEAHCISDWGHDFRPDYRRLLAVLQRMPRNVPILCTTATANGRVIADIESQVPNLEVRRGALMRESLELQAIRLPDQASRLAWLAVHVTEMPGTGIVYVLTKRDADQVAEWLRVNGIEARAYHSDSEDRPALEADLRENRLKALVATTALGMGFDKPDVGFVVHYQAPGSIIAYYQQIGRAGRAIDRAFCVLLAGVEDDEIHEYFRSTAFPEEAHVAAILEALGDSDGLSARELEPVLNLRTGQIQKVLQYLSVENPAPVFKDGSKWRRTPVPWVMDRAKIVRLTAQRETEWQEVKEYIDTPDCRMAFLARALDDKMATRCGRCDRCCGEPLASTEVPHALAVAATRFLRQAEFPLECKIQVAAGAFEVYGFHGNIRLELRAQAGRVLSRWGDSGWGQVVADDKHAGRFRYELVLAMKEMIAERWRPDPFPRWLTCVPSYTHPNLVPDFAKRLAGQLGIDFVQAVNKVRANEPQKVQQNRYRQCSNLDGVFEIDSDLVGSGPVLLIDDVVDSCWTMTVVAALLRQAGSGPVYPVALAEASTND
jgi:ATP-dependent DNA helicase RecQ